MILIISGGARQGGLVLEARVDELNTHEIRRGSCNPLNDFGFLASILCLYFRHGGGGTTRSWVHDPEFPTNIVRLDALVPTHMHQISGLVVRASKSLKFV